MTDQAIATQPHQTFEAIKKHDKEGNEYWVARQLSNFSQ